MANIMVVLVFAGIGKYVGCSITASFAEWWGGGGGGGGGGGARERSLHSSQG